MNKLCVIVAMGNSLEIGRDNRLLCQLPKDLKRFKALTLGHAVVMGARTWESLPKKPLPNRRNIVLTRQCHTDASSHDCEWASSLEEVLHMVETNDTVFIIGGATIYRQFMQYANELYITRILANFEADSFFPDINDMEWELKEEIFDPKDNENIYDVIYQHFVRKNRAFRNK